MRCLHIVPCFLIGSLGACMDLGGAEPDHKIAEDLAKCHLADHQDFDTSPPNPAISNQPKQFGTGQPLCQLATMSEPTWQK
jgi:hypothetical protein